MKMAETDWQVCDFRSLFLGTIITAFVLFWSANVSLYKVFILIIVRSIDTT